MVDNLVATEFGPIEVAKLNEFRAGAHTNPFPGQVSIFFS